MVTRDYAVEYVLETCGEIDVPEGLRKEGDDEGERLHRNARPDFFSFGKSSVTRGECGNLTREVGQGSLKGRHGFSTTKPNFDVALCCTHLNNLQIFLKDYRSEEGFKDLLINAEDIASD
ncbi:hypothetical protein CBL_08601 [Carabus blaptoides fortunei]